MEGNLNALTTVFTEFYYWVTIVFMFLIHVGFCTYEVGVSRRRSHMHTLMKNAMAIPLVTITFYFFGWWIYFAYTNGFGFWNFVDAPLAYEPDKVAAPWSPLMGTHLSGANFGRHHRARAFGCLLADRGVDRLRDVDPRRSLGLERDRMDGQSARLS
jgi:hypothetical protein